MSICARLNSSEMSSGHPVHFCFDTAMLVMSLASIFTLRTVLVAEGERRTYMKREVRLVNNNSGSLYVHKYVIKNIVPLDQNRPYYSFHELLIEKVSRFQTLPGNILNKMKYRIYSRISREILDHICQIYIQFDLYARAGQKNFEIKITSNLFRE